MSQYQLNKLLREEKERAKRKQLQNEKIPVFASSKKCVKLNRFAMFSTTKRTKLLPMDDDYEPNDYEKSILGLK